MKNKLIILIICLSLGCTTYRQNSELAWQVIHIADLGQTLNIANRPDCFRETDPLTSTLIGERPSKGEVIGVMIAYSILHFGVSRYLEYKVKKENTSGWKIIEGLWHVTGLATKSVTVLNNRDEGLRMFSHACKN